DARAGRDDRVELVREHGRRDLRVLDREHAAEAAALLGARQLDELDVAHRAKQAQRPVAEAKPAEAVAGRVIRHAVREGCADVLHAEPVDEELRQLEHARAERRRLAHEADARRRGRDDDVGAAEDRLEAARERGGLALVAAVSVHLAAARLLDRELDLVSEALEELDDRASGGGKERVVEAGEEERDPHAAARPPRTKARPSRARASGLSNMRRQIFVAPASSGSASPNASITTQRS